ncbi:toxin VasX [Providencia stuartii]|uniref:toxin VasX n=3 Tax=Providencia stuartii TaxID=588 RepID=UPI0030F19990
MTDNTRSPQLTLEEIERQMVELVNQLAPRNLQADAVVCPCENEHRPVYPVRYAYSNLYGDKNAKAAVPPAISTLLSASSISDTKGFSARLLRTGWVYVFEEGEFPTRLDTKGQLLIFKHVVQHYDNGYVYSDDDNSSEAASAKEKGDAEEGFIPYLRDPLTQSVQAQSCQYPYLPIKKDVMEALFLFSDSPLSDYVLDKMETDASYRQAFMQKINLVDFNGNPHALELNAEHIDYLVEEYKTESDQFSAFTEHTKSIGNPLPKEYFSHITGMNSASKSTDTLLNQAKQNLDYKEKSCLVALYDPIGYQKDILSLYTFVTATYAMFQRYWQYPNKVGHYLSALETQFDNPDVAKTEQGKALKEKFNKHIDVQGWKTYWPQIEAGNQEFETLQANIVQLYRDFLSNPTVKNQVGGIKNYLDHAFLIKEQYQKGDFWHPAFFDELEAYSQLHEQLFTPLNSSPSGRVTLDLLLSTDSDDGEIWKEFITNLLDVLNEDVIKDKALSEFKERVLPSLRLAVMICWDALGYAYTEAHTHLNNAKNSVRRISQAGLDFLAHKVLPAFLAYFGISVSFDELATLSAEEFRKWMSSLKGMSQPLQRFSKNMKKVFDWDNRLKSAGLKRVITTAKFNLMAGYRAAGLPTDKHAFISHIKLGADVYTLLTSIIEFNAVAHTKEFDKQDPLNAAAVNIFRIQMVAHILNTAEAVVEIRQAARGYAAAVTFPPLQRLLTKIQLPEIQTKLGKVGLKGLGYAVAILGVALPIAEASAEFYNSNYITGSAKIAEAAGTLALSVGLAAYGATEGVVATAVAAFAWELIIIGAIVFGIGMAVYNYFKTDAFEELLKQCFWGNGDKYFAGGYKTEDNIKISRSATKDKQLEKYVMFLERYADYYQTELQEFANLFFTSQLQANAIPKSKAGLGQSHYGAAHYVIQYQFTLGNFQCGISDVEYQLVEKKALFTYPAGTPVTSLPKQGGTVVKHRGIDYLASQQTKFNAAFEAALQDALACTALRDGELVLSFEVEAGIFVGDPLGQSIPSIYWYYLVDRLKGEIAPLRYRNGDPNDKLYGCIDEEGTE